MRTVSFALVFVLVTAGCAREEKPTDAVASGTTTTALPPTSLSTTSQQAQPAASYEDAHRWFQTTPGFRFVLRDGDVRAEGEMARPAIAAERVRLRIRDEEWIAATGANGVAWYRRNGKSWERAQEPPQGGRMYQRVTLAFDPKKREGSAQREGNRFQFTDSNTGFRHEIVVDDRGRIQQMRTGNKVELTISEPDRRPNIPTP